MNEWMTFISLFVKSLSGTAPLNRQQCLVEMQLFAFKHMLECTCTDSARGYSVSFSLPKHYVPVRCSHITVPSDFSSVWVQTLPPICISAAAKVVLAQRLQSLLFLSPGCIQSSAGVITALCFWKEIQIHPRTVRKRGIFSGSSALLIEIFTKWCFSILPVEKLSIKRPRPVKQGGQPHLKDDPVDVILEGPCKTEVKTQMIPHITHCLHLLLLHIYTHSG